MTRKSVQGGYCQWPDSRGCALTKLECDDPSNFSSSRQMQTGPVNAHGGSCRWQDSIRGTMLGRCDGDSDCSPNRESCPGGIDFQGEFRTTQELSCTVGTTSFGRCDYGMCAWSHDHCQEDNTWEAFDEGCTCDKVQVGACSRWKDGVSVNTEREVFCAVSEFACDNEQSWITPQEVMRAAGFDCFLCREKAAPGTADGDNMGVIAGDVVGAIGTNTSSNMSSSKKTNKNKTIFVASSIVGAAFAVIIISLVGWKVFKTNRAFKRAEDFGKEDPQGPPTTAIEVDIGNNSKFGASTDDMDNASVLSDE